MLSLDGWIADRSPGLVSDAWPTRRQRERRALLTTGSLAVLLGGFTALLGRLSDGHASAAGRAASRSSVAAQGKRHSAQPRPTAAPHTEAHTGAPAGMRRVEGASGLRVGRGGQFRDPATGNPAWLIRTGQQSFAAFSAVCTHAGCTVSYDSDNREFVCPCHGGTYSATTGAVLGGPPPAPLGTIEVRVANGQVYVR